MRNFVFSGTFRDGTFEGQHAELLSDRRKATGTMVLGVVNQAGSSPVRSATEDG